MKNRIKCYGCGNESRSAVWVGACEVDGKDTPFRGFVKYHAKDDSFHLDGVLGNLEKRVGKEVTNFYEGDAQCLKCGASL